MQTKSPTFSLLLPYFCIWSLGTLFLRRFGYGTRMFQKLHTHMSKPNDPLYCSFLSVCPSIRLNVHPAMHVLTCYHHRCMSFWRQVVIKANMHTTRILSWHHFIGSFPVVKVELRFDDHSIQRVVLPPRSSFSWQWHACQAHCQLYLFAVNVTLSQYDHLSLLIIGVECRLVVVMEWLPS